MMNRAEAYELYQHYMAREDEDMAEYWWDVYFYWDDDECD